MHRLLSAGVLSALLCAAPALADVGKKNGEIGFDFGATKFDSGVTEATGGRFVFRGGYHFTDLFELEGHVASSTGTEDFFGLNLDTTLSTWFVDGVFNFHPGRKTVVPYVLVGVGSANGKQELDGVTVVDENGSAYQVAVGSRFFFGSNERAAFRVELSSISESIGPDTSTHTNLVGGFTWRMGH